MTPMQSEPYLVGVSLGQSSHIKMLTKMLTIQTLQIGSDIPTNLNFIKKIQTKEEINPFAVKKMFEANFS